LREKNTERERPEEAHNSRNVDSRVTLVKKELEDFKSKCDIVKVVSHYVSLEKAGSSYRGLCPFHEERTPSFYVNPEKKFFHCFGCGAGGDVIEFVKKIENVSFIEAVQRVAEICGVSSPIVTNDGFYSKYVQMMKSVAEAYKNALFSAKGRQALSYLTENRGLSKEDVKKFDLGYAPINSNVVGGVARQRGIGVEDLIKYGLIIRSRSGRLREFFQNRVIFPIKDSSGKIVAFGGRSLTDEVPKYINSPESRYFSKSKLLYLFNIARYKIKKSGFAILCEGYMDAIAFHRHGFDNACAVLGTNLTKFHLNMLRRVTNNLLFVLDSDSAGISAMQRIAKVLVGEDFNVKVMVFRDSKDPDEFFSIHGKEEFQKTLSEAKDYWDFYVQQSLGELGDPLKAIYRFKRSISWINSSILKRQLVSKAAKVLMIEEKDILYELQNKKSNVNSHDSSSVRMTVDDYVIYLLFLNENMRSKVIEKIDAEVLSPLARKTFKIVSSGVTLPQEAMRFFGREEGERFFQIFTYDEHNVDADDILDLCVSELERRKVKSQIEKLEREIVSTVDREQKAELMKKAMKLRSLLKKRGDASNGSE